MRSEARRWAEQPSSACSVSTGAVVLNPCNSTLSGPLVTIIAFSSRGKASQDRGYGLAVTESGGSLEGEFCLCVRTEPSLFIFVPVRAAPLSAQANHREVGSLLGLSSLKRRLWCFVAVGVLLLSGAGFWSLACHARLSTAPQLGVTRVVTVCRHHAYSPSPIGESLWWVVLSIPEG